VWAAGEIPLVLVVFALLIQWSRATDRSTRKPDRAAGRDTAAELAAHDVAFVEIARSAPRTIVERCDVPPIRPSVGSPVDKPAIAGNGE
jgi:hypothetical protein